MPVDAPVHAVLQEHALVTVARWDHAAVHEVELDELCVGQVQVHRHQLTTAALHGVEGPCIWLTSLPLTLWINRHFPYLSYQFRVYLENVIIIYLLNVLICV